MVTDVSASQGLEQGDILYALISEVQGYAMSIGSATYKLSPRFKPKIIQFRKELEEDFGSVCRTTGNDPSGNASHKRSEDS